MANWMIHCIKQIHCRRSVLNIAYRTTSFCVMYAVLDKIFYVCPWIIFWYRKSCVFKEILLQYTSSIIVLLAGHDRPTIIWAFITVIIWIKIRNIHPPKIKVWVSIFQLRFWKLSLCLLQEFSWWKTGWKSVYLFYFGHVQNFACRSCKKLCQWTQSWASWI